MNFEAGTLFYNTIELTGNELEKAQLKAGTQDYEILALFKLKGSDLTPSEVLNAYHHWNVPLTSVRRAINTLTALGYLEKTKTLRMGMYGKPEHAWRLCTN